MEITETPWADITRAMLLEAALSGFLWFVAMAFCGLAVAAYDDAI
jgi:hypothetical protein